MDKKVLVTGASSGIGKAISELLVNSGCEVYGIGRSFESENITVDEELNAVENVITSLHANENNTVLGSLYAIKNSLDSLNAAKSNKDEHKKTGTLHKIVYDLTDVTGLKSLVSRLRADREFDILINNAGCAYYGTHDNITPAQIHEMVTVNLEVPMILSSLMLKDMKKRGGMIINISSVTAHKVNTHGCAYGATKAGLSSFGDSLFEECRKCGIKVINIHPDMTDTALYRNADFKAASDNPEAALCAEDIAEAVKKVIEAPDGMVVTNLTIRPQKHMLERK
jgi:NADP-dependent 3-hydroxy acid dehydrogenase YdfG